MLSLNQHNFWLIQNVYMLSFAAKQLSNEKKKIIMKCWNTYTYGWTYKLYTNAYWMCHTFFSFRMNCQPNPLHRLIFEFVVAYKMTKLWIFICDSFIKMISMQWVKRSKANHMPIIRLLDCVRELVAYGNSIEFSLRRVRHFGNKILTWFMR